MCQFNCLFITSGQRDYWSPAKGSSRAVNHSGARGNLGSTGHGRRTCEELQAPSLGGFEMLLLQKNSSQVAALPAQLRSSPEGPPATAVKLCTTRRFQIPPSFPGCSLGKVHVKD